MIERLSIVTARAIKRAAPDHRASEAVLKFALEGVYNVVFILVLTLTISLLTRKISEVSVMLLSFAVLRQITGGVHLRSGVLCVLTTTTMFTLFSFVEMSRKMNFYMSIISIFCVVIFAPSRIERQSRIPKRYYPILKLAGVLVVSVAFFVDYSALSLSFFVQSLTLIRLKGGDIHD
ncbi:accessory gene regulator ArgB-like protein [Paenibacillus graminis]|uniref:Accessory gene regulator AgrB n=1 Tax=Paenibacillus graminis TaxID=189425 RepID=A0A089M6T6_9BACL|nr:accessory gene regulator B family protein [Paenibacillus graminis]AIQ69511.1 hypothetical protein PGRAT_19115 [Paenibacillus graminis]